MEPRENSWAWRSEVGVLLRGIRITIGGISSACFGFARDEAAEFIHGAARDSNGGTNERGGRGGGERRGERHWRGGVALSRRGDIAWEKGELIDVRRARDARARSIR